MKKEDITVLSYVHPIIFFDGVCHLCDASIQKLLKWDKKEIFRFATIQFGTERQLFETSLDSVILLYKGQIFLKSTAVIQILILLGGKYHFLAKVLKLFPDSIMDFGYSIIAKYRYRWFGKYNECVIPDESHKVRFLLIN
jgi:predicted DCC family thiol-disulfide oxidoreductase YuxK